MSRRRRRPALLPDEVIPPALTDPARQAARDRRWARKTAAGSMSVLALFGTILAEIFQPGRTRPAIEQQRDQAQAALGLRVGEPDEDGTGRFRSWIRLR